MSETPRGKLETPIGTVNFAMTQADHVFLNTDSQEGMVIVIRQIPYHLGFHCYLVDGQWKAKDWHDPYLSRKDSYAKETSQAARNTAREILSKAWTEYLAANPTLTRAAALAHAQEIVERLRGELADLEQKAKDKKAETKAAEKSLKEI